MRKLLVLTLLLITACTPTLHEDPQALLITDLPDKYELVRNASQPSDDMLAQHTLIHQVDVWGEEDKLLLQEVELYATTQEAQERFANRTRALDQLPNSTQAQVPQIGEQTYARTSSYYQPEPTRDVWTYIRDRNAVILVKYVKTEPSGDEVNNTVQEAQQLLHTR